MAKKKTSLTPEQRLQEALVPESEWPYQVPKNWCWVKLGNIANFERGITFPASAKEHEQSDSNIPCLRTANVQETLEIDDLIYIDKCFMKGNPHKLVCVEDIIMSSANSRELVGKTSYVECVPFPMTFGGFVLNIRARNIASRLLFYYLRLEFLSGKFMGESTQTTNIANINTTTLGNYSFPLPPLSEQQRIVEHIESLFAKLDEAKQKAQDVLDGFETRKAAILHKAFTGELTTKWRREYNVKKENWVELPLKDCGEWSGGGTPSMQHPEYWDNGNIPWITSKDMKSDIIQDTLIHTTMLGIENSSARYINKPSLLFVTRSGILRRTFPVCMVKKPFTVNQDLKVLTPSEINLDFMFWACKAHEREILDTCMKSGTTVESINTAALKNHRIPVPSIPEQEEIVRILDDLLSKEQQAKEAAESVLEQIDLIKKSILARAFRGELGTNDPAEVSSVELLKEILGKED